jgi:outer membrane receptor protein involved in Fe transport
MKRIMKLNNEAKFRFAVRSALVAGIAGVASAPAAAQETAATPATGEKPTELETLQVTGSRLPQPGLTAVSPVATVNSQEVQLQGVTRIEDLLNQLPQVFADQGAYLANGATGTATVNLRGLGAERTLVLIDGKRMIPGDPGAPAPDLNNIPAALIDRVEIVTGGASAVYGSDALAGVVNFIMLRDFEGVRLDYHHSFFQAGNRGSQDDAVNDAVGRKLTAGGNPVEFFVPDSSTSDGANDNLTFVMGVNTGDGKGNATMYVNYLTVNAVDQGQRGYSSCALGRDVANDRYTCSGSSTNRTGRFTDFASFNSTVVSDGAGGGAFRNFSNATDQFNFNPYNYFQRNDERYGLGAFSHYEFNPHVDVYTDIMYMDDRTDAVIAPSGSFFVDVTTDCSNPLIGTVDPDGAGAASQSQLDVICGDGTFGSGNTAAGPITFYLARRNVEGGGRDDDLRHTNLRGIVGTKGQIIEGVNYDVYGQYGQTLFNEIYRKDFSVTRIRRAIDVVDDGSGNAVCASFLNGTDPACVPWNIWAPGGVTPAALEYLQVPGFQEGQTTERIVSAAVTADLGKFGVTIPSATDGISIAAGAEYRREESRLETDNAFTTGDLAGQGGPRIGVSGAFQVRELFTEASLPIVQGRPFVEYLGLELGYRYSDYDPAGPANTYKIGGQWGPTKDVSVRAAFNRATRAPNVVELAQPVFVALAGNTDPCAGAADNGADGVAGNGDDMAAGGATRSQCSLDPFFAANPGTFGSVQENPAAQYNGLYGSSPGLEPETADTTIVGIVFTPTFLKDFSATVDYYDITIDGLVGSYGADTILDTCYSGNTSVCGLIHRDTFGSLWITSDGYTEVQILNTGSLSTKGVDFELAYRLKLPEFGALSFDFRGTSLAEYEVQPIPGGASFTCDGLYGLQCGTPTPKWRHKFRTTWQMPYLGATASVQWRHIASVDADSTSLTISNDKTLDAANYVDLAGSIPIVSGYSARLGINNVLDLDPPAINQTALPSVSGSGNTFPQVYDWGGRYIYLGVQANF